MKTALIAGASGLVGQNCLSFLTETATFGRIISVGRREVNQKNQKLTQVISQFEPFEHLDAAVRTQLGDGTLTDAFCCLGTTIKVAGSKDAFRKVDFNYIVDVAKISQALGAKRFFLVSALGANSQSAVFYNRVKGETENAVREVGFQETFVFRPSLLLGERKEFRLAEKIGMALSRPVSKLMVGPLHKFVPISARDVARAMVKSAERSNRADERVGKAGGARGGHQGSRFHVIQSNDIQKIADGSM